jgi:hypothetical protein
MRTNTTPVSTIGNVPKIWGVLGSLEELKSVTVKLVRAVQHHLLPTTVLQTEALDELLLNPFKLLPSKSKELAVLVCPVSRHRLL